MSIGLKSGELLNDDCDLFLTVTLTFPIICSIWLTLIVLSYNFFLRAPSISPSFLIVLSFLSVLPSSFVIFYLYTFVCSLFLFLKYWSILDLPCYFFTFSVMYLSFVSDWLLAGLWDPLTSQIFCASHPPQASSLLSYSRDYFAHEWREQYTTDFACAVISAICFINASHQSASIFISKTILSI